MPTPEASFSLSAANGAETPQRLTEHRAALDQLLQQARLLESEIERLATDLDSAEAQEQRALERSAQCAAALQDLASRRTSVEERAFEVQQNAALAEQRVALARRELERATAALVQSDGERAELERAEEQARAELEAARSVVRERRAKSGDIEGALAKLQQRIGTPPALALEESTNGSAALPPPAQPPAQAAQPPAPPAEPPAQPAQAKSDADQAPEPAAQVPVLRKLASRVPRMSTVAVIIAIGILIAVACGVLFTTRWLNAALDTTSICKTSMTSRLADNLVRGYVSRYSTASHFVLLPAGDDPCQVRFWTAQKGARGLIVGHEALVVAVNPRNPIDRITEEQLRGIVSGRLTDWSQLGTGHGPIAVLLPVASSDEEKLIAANVLAGEMPSAAARRLSSSEIVRAVAGASGRNALGLVPFSASMPAKIIALGSGTPPSTLSIADGSYPLSVDVLADSDWRKPPSRAREFLAFAHSRDGQTVVMHSGLVSSGGL